MSSEDSGEEGELINRPLPWRDETLTSFFGTLDRRYESSLSPFQRRMMSNRETGENSERTPESVPEALQTWVRA